MQLSGLRTDKTRTTQRTGCFAVVKVTVTVTLIYPCKNDENLVFESCVFCKFLYKISWDRRCKEMEWDKLWIWEMKGNVCIEVCVCYKYGFWLPLWVIHAVHAWIQSQSVLLRLTGSVTSPGDFHSAQTTLAISVSDIQVAVGLRSEWD